MSQRIAAAWSRLHTGVAFALACTLVLSGGKGERAHAGERDSATFPYRSYNETEIAAALQRPLSLEDCIGIALSRNTSLRIAAAELAKTEATQAGSYGLYAPVFSLTATRDNTLQKRPLDELEQDSTAQLELTFNNQAVVGGLSQLLPTGALLNFSGDLSRDLNSPDRFNAPPTRTRIRAYTVSLTQPLLRDAWPGIVNSPVRAARYAKEAQSYEYLNAKWQAVYLVKQAFYEVLLQRELISVNEAAIQRDSTLVAASESKVIAKLATRRDVLSAEIQLADDKTKLIKSQTDFQLALDALKHVMGLSITLPITVAEMELRYEVEALSEADLIAEAVRANPSLHSMETAVKLSRLQLTQSKNQRLPRLDLVAEYTGKLEGELQEATALYRDLETTGWRAAVNLSYPLLNPTAAAEAENARMALTQQEDRLAELQRSVTLNVRSIIRSIYSSGAEIDALRRTIEAAEQKVDFATTMFNLGRASNLDITDAQEALLKAQTQYVGKLVDYHTQVALLESYVGRPITPQVER